MTFTHYREALDVAELRESDAARAPDTGGDCLPFDHLEDRRFEILVYRLQCAEHDDRAKRVRLMRGTGDRGRDVLVYGATGRLERIGQCKHYRDSVTRPMLIRELLKLAFHAAIDRSIVPPDADVIGYDIWAPGGLTEPAAAFVDTWPAEWTAPVLELEVDRVLREYAAFDELRWDEVKDFVAALRGRFRLRHWGRLDISALVRKHTDIYAAFFEGSVVMRKEDVAESLEEIVRRTTGEQVRYANDRDARHVLDRITSFGADERLVSSSALVMGLKPQLVSRFKRGEYERFAKHLIEGIAGLIMVVVDACNRIQRDIVREFREAKPRGRWLPDILAQLLTFSMTSRAGILMMRGLNLQPKAAEYDGLTLDQRFEVELLRLWQSFQDCLSRYDPARHPPGSDEEFRSRVAAVALEGVESREAFESELRASYAAHRHEIERIYEEWMALVPKQILVVADTLSIFESEWLFRRMEEGVELLTSLRGSAVIPE